jgi:hypothetical protein
MRAANMRRENDRGEGRRGRGFRLNWGWQTGIKSRRKLRGRPLCSRMGGEVVERVRDEREASPDVKSEG